MGLTVLPAETDNSLGRDKVDKSPPKNYALQTVAAEYNVLKHSVYDLCQAVGLANGLTQGSLEQLARAVNDPGCARPDAFALMDDLYVIDTDIWTTIANGTAVVGIVPCDLAGQAKGFGLLQCSIGGSGSEAGIIDTVGFTCGAHNPRITTYLKTPETDNEIYFGLVDQWPSPGCYAYIKGVSGTWNIYSRSGLTDTDTELGTCNGNTWYKISIEISNATWAKYYIDDVLIGTLDTALAIPDDNDPLCRFVMYKQPGSTNDNGLVDYIDMRGDRIP